ncbi:glycosyltransferase family 2 protein [Ferrimonas kyonanensis]|uniref:glycosyltransferase family 2 protein n=1 Tax=Ferrimonas kyonanensis TaxID=364763 RepID=UPI0004182CC3|nr:glycosyltransferase family 2 protein [Ferrimonas kyonanensis]
MTACLLIPHYNHGQQLAPVLERLAAMALPCVVVDDGSSAEELAAVEALAARHDWVTLVRRPVNGGKGAAVKTGILWARQQGFSHAVQVDADGQHDLDDLPQLLSLSKRQPDAVVTGIPRYDESVPRHRYLARYLTHVWVWVETLSLELKDTMCGFRVYPVAAVANVIEQQRVGDRMDFDPEILVRLFWQGTPIIQQPTSVIYPEQGRSHFRALEDNWLISCMHTRLVFGMLWRLPSLLFRKRRRKHWSSVSERGAMWGLKTLLWLYRHGGRWLCRAVLPFIIGYFFVTGTEARQASKAYLTRANAAREAQGLPSIGSGNWASYRHFLTFGQAALTKLDAWSGKLNVGPAQFPNRQLMVDLFERGQGAMILTAHFGNIEIFRAAAESEFRKRINVLALTRHAAKFNAILAELNPRSQVELLQVDELGPETAIVLQERVAAGELVIIAGDRTSATNFGRVHYSDFLGQAAAFSIGPYVLASVLDCPLYLMLGLPGDPTPELHFEKLAAPLSGPRKTRQQRIGECIDHYARKLEQQVIRHPLHWFNFYDFWLRDDGQLVDKE